MNEKAFNVLEYNKIIEILSEYASSEQGKELVRNLLPSKEYYTVEARQKETDDAVSIILKRGNPPIDGIADIREALTRVELGGVLSLKELLNIASNIRVVKNLKNYLKSAKSDELEETDNGIHRMISILKSHDYLEKRISDSILNEEEISDTASSTLYKLRKQIADSQSSIKEKLYEMIRSSKYQKYIQESIVTMRGDRYVIPVKQEYRNEIQGMVHDYSTSGATVFIEPISAVESNNKIKELKIKEKEEIERIIRELTSEVAKATEELKVNYNILIELDFIFAKGKMALEYDGVSPKLNKNGKIKIINGKHPLIDKSKVVPINFWIGENFRTLVVTGPNTGGKTVTLKTVGLFVLMTQAGLYIPASYGTEIAVFEGVYADIGDEQSIEQSLSTFSSHMKNIVEVLNVVNDKSLVLFDELGSGTDPDEGAALAMSVLEYLYEKGAVTVATTHYSELKVYALTTDGVENACCEFDVLTLRPTYKLLIGVPGSSNAFLISKRLGLSNEIIEKAKKFLNQETVKFEDILMAIEKNRSETEEEKIKAKLLKNDLEKLKDEIVKEKARIEEERNRILKEAKEEAKRLVLGMKAESESIIKELKRLEKEQSIENQNKAIMEIKQKIKKNEENIKSKFVTVNSSFSEKKEQKIDKKMIKPGVTVKIISFDQKGIVLSEPDKKDEVLVQVGIMKINVPLKDMVIVDEMKEESFKTKMARLGIEKTKVISTELDIRGNVLDDAIEAVDKFLDDASMAGLPEVTLIHGKGTGVLRSGIHQFLKNHSHVKSFRQGRYGEGEMGVTIVQLK